MPIVAKVVLTKTADPFVSDRLRLRATRAYLKFLDSGHYSRFDSPERGIYTTSVLNLAEDLRAICDVAGVDSAEIRWQPNLPRLPTNPVFVPPFSGFFSTVYAVLCHQFVFREKAIIDDHLWPYALGLGKLLGYQSMPSGGWRGGGSASARVWVRDRAELHQPFFDFSRNALIGLYRRCRELIQESGLKLPDAGRYEVFFIRRGDKLKAESLDIPQAAYLRSVAARKDCELLLVGDDDFFIRDLQAFNPSLRSYSPFKPIKGSVLNSAVSLERTMAILVNFCVLCEAAKVTGDPNCNLVAAALAMRGDRGSADNLLFPWPRHVVI